MLEVFVTTHNEHFLTHPAIQTLIHSSFFGDPIELGSTPWTTSICYRIQHQPLHSHHQLHSTQPTVESSRIHTVHKYTFPPTAADCAVRELIQLYIHKGHAPSDCWRFLRENWRAVPDITSERRLAAVCACVILCF